MTAPDAATEALAEIMNLISSAIRGNADLDPAGMALIVRNMLSTRGYVIRKARKSG